MSKKNGPFARLRANLRRQQRQSVRAEVVRTAREWSKACRGGIVHTEPTLSAPNTLMPEARALLNAVAALEAFELRAKK